MFSPLNHYVKMNLQKWFDAEKGRRVELAKATGVTRVQLWRIAKGMSVPKMETAELIEKHTAGAVTLADLYQKKGKARRRMRRSLRGKR